MLFWFPPLRTKCGTIVNVIGGTLLNVKEKNQIIVNYTLKKDVYCQQRTGRLSVGHTVLFAV